ncbi:MAG: hypothetical protein GY809_27825, partial [Planctomycetes bacterium]|nr:hypothetical protein [Planctomycetota bacterium]
HQQGRVLLDQDGNAANVITSSLRQLQGRDAIGPHVAAVPAEAKNSFKVTQAHTDGTAVDVTWHAGTTVPPGVAPHPARVWVDGWALQVPDSVLYARAVKYLAPPFQAPQADLAPIVAGIRDAVILEVWEEALNAFQDPANLIEPALGGVDTTERVKLFYDLKLLRLASGDSCGNLVDKLADKFADKGKLDVTPAPTLGIGGECPVALGGGYTGFEHHLFRIEIAEPDGVNARFKWSRFNGGLVGRGTFVSAPGGTGTVAIRANDQMINHCGLNSFYLEALVEGAHGGRWTVEFSAQATLASDGTLALTHVTGTWPGDATTGEAFFRLWDGEALITDFPKGLPAPNELVTGLGIRLAFDVPAANHSNYTPGDFWTFPVRTSGTEDFDPATEWPNDDPPQGIHYHRVPLAILNWYGAPSTATPVTLAAPGHIHDCRRIFQPLAKLDSCCLYTVGDGMRSSGDYDAIQAAIDDLPPQGGRICVLPGEYHENLVIKQDNVILRGCGPDSHITAASKNAAVHILGASHVTLQGLRITAHREGQGIHLEADARGQTPQHILLEALVVNAAKRSAVQLDAGRFLSLQNNHILMADVASPWPGVYVTGDDVLFEHNTVAVTPASLSGDVVTVTAGRGGIQLGGGSERVQIIDNLIQGGIGNGITLGTVEAIDPNGNLIPGRIAWVVNADDPCDPCAPASVYYPPRGRDDDGPTYQSAGTMYDVRIERNRVLDMGLNGIGVIMFFNLDAEDEFISVEGLDILGNSIRRCLTRELEVIPDEMQNSMGYGGLSLADVENLVVHDNHIEDNGPNHLEPICGIFVLHGEGIDISRNRILNNGAKTRESASNAKLGPRGGIYVVYSTAPKIPIWSRKGWYQRQNGVTALKVHDNIISQPLGRALSVTAIGPVSVVANQLTSQGMVYNFEAPSFVASTVFIFNLGISNELYLQQLLFSGEILPDRKDFIVAPEDSDFIIKPQKGIDDQQPFAYLGNGNVMFNDNQVLLDLIDTTGAKLSMVSIAIGTLDDVSFADNQCDASFDFGLDDFVLSQTLLFGWTVRACGNRFKESVMGALFSALTMSFFANTTVHNQGTHCIRALNAFGSSNLYQQPNAILFDIWRLCTQDDVKGQLIAGRPVLLQAKAESRARVIVQ